MILRELFVSIRSQASWLHMKSNEFKAVFFVPIHLLLVTVVN